MVSVVSGQIVQMQGHLRVIDESLEKLTNQVDIELADHPTNVCYAVFQSRSTRQINHYPGQCLVKRDIGVPVAAHPFFVANRLCEGLSKA